MRPLFLRMQAFGPFPGVEQVDFTTFRPDAFLLIHGETGAGKTMLLDAMCYALFGETSGSERSGADVRSQLAGPDLPTEVVLDFEVGGAAFRVADLG